MAEDIVFPLGEENPFAKLGESIRITYSYVNEAGDIKEESKNFVVTAIMQSTGNPTIDNAVVINLMQEMHYFKGPENMIHCLLPPLLQNMKT